MAKGREFGDLVKQHMLNRVYREVASAVGMDYSTLYNWARGFVPTDERKVRRFARHLGLSEAEEGELVEAAKQAIDTGRASKALIELTDIAETRPDALAYDPDLEDADIMGLLEKAHPEDRETLLRVVRAYLSEVRRRD